MATLLPACYRCGGRVIVDDDRDELVRQPDKVCLNCGRRVAAVPPIDLSLDDSGARRVARPTQGGDRGW